MVNNISFIYRNNFIYSLFIRILYGKFYNNRYRKIGELIPSNISVLDICCGDCRLYENELKNRVKYIGIDINHMFLKTAAKKGIDVKRLDIRYENLPKSDYLILQASLYQFIPNHKDIVDKMIRAAGDKVIISETVVNVSSSKLPLIAYFAKYSANPATGHTTQRFTSKTFIEFIKNNYSELLEDCFLHSSGKELLVVLNAKDKS